MFNARTLIKAGLVAALLAPTTAFASAVYGTDASGDLNDSRSTGGSGLGLVGGVAGLSVSVAWDISLNGDGTIHYSYTVTESDKKGLSHFILDLSDNCTAIGDCFKNFGIAGSDTNDGLVFGTYNNTSNGNSDPEIPGEIIGVKIDNIVDDGDGIFTFSFDSNRAPVWGDFYFKVGNPPAHGYAVWDLGLADHTDASTGDFIVVPDTETISDPGFCVVHPDLCTIQNIETPEPATLALFGAGLAGLGAMRRRRKRS